MTSTLEGDPNGRKSRSVRVDGYKRHVMRDLDSELVVAVGITPANAPEASVAEEIKSDLKRQQIILKELHIDRVYLSSTLVSERSAELEIFCLRRCAVVNNPHIFARRTEIMAQAA